MASRSERMVPCLHLPRFRYIRGCVEHFVKDKQGKRGGRQSRADDAGAEDLAFVVYQVARLALFDITSEYTR